MTQTQRTYLEEKLFRETNKDAKLKDVVKRVFEKYKSITEIMPDNHEAKFGVLYCEMKLKNSSKIKPNFTQIIKYTRETQTTYYAYRKSVLNHIFKEIEGD